MPDATGNSGIRADVSAHEREIDDRIYRLYGLSKDEIKIVEGSA
jgi:hypothetical protein